MRHIGCLLSFSFDWCLAESRGSGDHCCLIDHQASCRALYLNDCYCTTLENCWLSTVLCQVSFIRSLVMLIWMQLVSRSKFLQLLLHYQLDELGQCFSCHTRLKVCNVNYIVRQWRFGLFGPRRRRVPKRHSSCSCSCSCCWSQFSEGPEIPKAFLICSGVQRNFAYTFMLTLPTYLPSQIFTYFLINE